MIRKDSLQKKDQLVVPTRSGTTTIEQKEDQKKDAPEVATAVPKSTGQGTPVMDKSDSDSDLSSDSNTKDYSSSSSITKYNLLRTSSLGKAYRTLKQQQKEDFDLVQSDASQSESETYIPQRKVPASIGSSLLRTPKAIHSAAISQQSVSQSNRLVCINRPSLLSRDATEVNSYQGFLNLAIIILVGMFIVSEYFYTNSESLEVDDDQHEQVWYSIEYS